MFVQGALFSDTGQKPHPQDIGPALIFLWAWRLGLLLRAALNRRVVMFDDGLLWAATLAGARRINIYDIRTVDARSFIGKGSDLHVMILKDGDGRQLWLT